YFTINLLQKSTKYYKIRKGVLNMKLTPLRKRRIKVGMSEDVVSDYLGIAKGSLSMIERGHDNLRLEYAVKLSKLYKCTVDDICRDLGLL
ncbi:helix-turn-helix transcriptional regulator, partial [Clostridium sp. CAG:265]|uniref:helix-turn-helix domain-containing protein n=2 Tax=Clostridium TaxID=1485 RepID=UPI002671D134